VAYLSLYRKYRSQTFGDLVGQDQVVRTLQNSISQGKVSHAFLFTGPRGTGKTSSARLLAKALNCEKGPAAEPCNDCDICKSITDGNCMDVVELDAASNSGVDNVRDNIVGTVDYAPAYCRYKVMIIDEVHDLSPKAFDALLKTVEEPPPHIVFILATTEYSKVPPTIRARCQRHDFHRATIAQLVQRLAFVGKEEGLTIEPAALSAIARIADGGYRDALTLLEQAMIIGEGKITLEQVYDQLGMVSEELVDDMLLAIRSGEVKVLLGLLEEVYRRGRDPRTVLESMLHRLSELTRAAYGVEVGADPDSTVEATLHDVSSKLGRDHLNRFRAALADMHKEARDVSLPRLWLEAELVTLAVGVRAAPVSQVAPAPTPTAVVSAQVKPATPAPTRPEPVVPTGDPALDAARAHWAQVKAVMASKSPTAAAKLAKVSLASLRDGVATLEFTREMDLDWVKDSPKRQGLIQEEIANIVGTPGWMLTFVVNKNGQKAAATDTVAVELPAEGAKLVEMGKEVFEGF